MKRIYLFGLGLLLVAGCSSKETVETEYFNEAHNEIVEEILGDPLSKDETTKIFNESDAIDVYYEWIDESKVALTIFNNMDYYFSGDVEFEVCPVNVKTTGLAPKSYATATIECPDFVEKSEFEFKGRLYERNQKNEYPVKYETYYYEDVETAFDYVLELDKISKENLLDLARFIYTENVASNWNGEMTVRVFPKKEYDLAYEKNSADGWKELEKHLVGSVWIDSNEDFAEVYDGNGDLIDRLNFR